MTMITGHCNSPKCHCPKCIEARVVTYRGNTVDAVEHDQKTDVFTLLNFFGDVVAELKRHEFLSQPQLRKVKLHNGKHRRTSPALRSGPSFQSSVPVTAGTGVFSTALPGTFSVTWGAGRLPEHRTIDDAGIRAGEVIAQRCWRIINGGLTSVYMRDCEWLPGEPVTGDVRKDHGVHAFKDMESVDEYLTETRMVDHCHFFEVILLDGKVDVKNAATPFAIGTISLWGEIVEHRWGYRAEFGKIRSIESLWNNFEDDGPALLARLHARYGVRDMK